jgi:hypothetical protein
MTKAAGWSPERIREFVLNGVDGAWLPDDEKRTMRKDFERELDELQSRLDQPAPA